MCNGHFFGVPRVAVVDRLTVYYILTSIPIYLYTMNEEHFIIGQIMFPKIERIERTEL